MIKVKVFLSESTHEYQSINQSINHLFGSGNMAQIWHGIIIIIFYLPCISAMLCIIAI